MYVKCIDVICIEKIICYSCGRWRSVREKGIMKLILSIIFRQNFLLHHKLLITRNENFRKPIFFSFLFFFSSFWFYVSKVENKLCARFLSFLAFL